MAGVNHFQEPNPVVALLLASPVEPVKQTLHHLIPKRFNTLCVISNPVVMVGPTLAGFGVLARALRWRVWGISQEPALARPRFRLAGYCVGFPRGRWVSLVRSLARQGRVAKRNGGGLLVDECGCVTPKLARALHWRV